IDLTVPLAVDRNEIPERLHEQTTLREVHCAFPRCTRPARTCDHDHTAPHAQGGRTCTCNLAPLCRRHHRLKTHTRWTYTTPTPGTHHWTTPHGHTYLTNPTGTHTTTQPPPAPPPRGCWHPDG
ncbi:HNH endonuclease signature motif containing protein, partial [Nocardioides sp.]|uniref:HNH endonuclease signature motif containing protein n=1 Tax=Nocardioides sp. TaxID=35761 RepID=UPI003D0B386B